MADSTYNIKIKVDADTSAAKAAINGITGITPSGGGAKTTIGGNPSISLAASAAMQTFSTNAMRAANALVTFSEKLASIKIKVNTTDSEQRKKQPSIVEHPASSIAEANKNLTLKIKAPELIVPSWLSRPLGVTQPKPLEYILPSGITQQKQTIQPPPTQPKAQPQQLISAPAQPKASTSSSGGSLSAGIALKTMAGHVMAASNALQVFAANLGRASTQRSAPSQAVRTTPPSTTTSPSSRFGWDFNSAFSSITGSVAQAMPSAGSGLMSMVTGTVGGLVRVGSALAGGVALAFGPVGAVVGTVVNTLGSVVSGLLNAFGRLGDALLSIPGMLMGMAKNIVMSVGAMAAAFAGAVYGAHKTLSPAAEMDRYKSQLAFMGKSILLDFYKQVALKSPLSLKETVQGGVLAENYGLDSKVFLPLATDMASAFKVPIDELMRAFGYLKSGRTGEGLESIRRFGISNKDLEAKGIKFEKSGEVSDKSKADILNAVQGIASARFAGIADNISKSYEGAVSNLGDAIFQSFAGAFEKVLPYATSAIRSVTDGITAIGAKVANIDWRPAGEALNRVVESAKALVTGIDWGAWGQKIANVFEKAANIANSLFSEEGRTKLIQGLKDTWNTIAGQIGPILQTSLSLLGTTMKIAFTEGANIIAETIKSAVSPKKLLAGAYDVATTPLRALTNIPMAAGKWVSEGGKGSKLDAMSWAWNVTKPSNWVNNGLDTLAPKTGSQRSSIDDLKAESTKLIEQLSTMASGIAKVVEPVVATPAQSKIDVSKYKLDTSWTETLVKDAASAASAITAVKIDTNNPSASIAAIDKMAQDFATKKTAADTSIKLRESERDTMVRQMQTDGVAPSTVDAIKQEFDRIIMNLKASVTGSTGQVDSAKAAATKAANDAQRDALSYQAATNKILTKMLAELKALNEFSMSDVADSVFA